MKLHFFSDYSIIIRSMKKVKHILEVFLHSLIPQDSYYPKLLHIRLSYSLNYYFLFTSTLALIFTSIVLCQFSPGKIIAYKNSVINSLSSFPSEVQITIKNGTLESNMDRPLFLWVYQNKQPLFVFMVNTKDELKISKIPLPFIFLGLDKAQFLYRDNVYIKPYIRSWNMIIAKEQVQLFVKSINSFFPSFLISFYVFLLLLIPILFMTSSTSLIFLSSTLTYILLRTFIPHIHIKKCVQAGMHGTHLPIGITILLLSLFPSATNIAPIAMALFFVFTLVATYEMYSKEVPHRKGR